MPGISTKDVLDSRLGIPMSASKLKMLGLIAANKLPGVTEYLAGELRRLAQACADFGVLAANTPHIVFDELRRQSPISFVSLVEVTCQAARAQGGQVGLFGARFTMQGRFYTDVFAQAGIIAVTPALEEQVYSHDKYLNELVTGILSVKPGR
jgi:aspartate racemase